MSLTIEFIDGPFEPSKMSVTISLGESIKIGRLPACEVFVPDPSVSGKHFSVTATPEQISLKDLGSRNGTFVNGQRIKSADLRDGDEILVGKTRFCARIVNRPLPSPRPLDNSHAVSESKESSSVESATTPLGFSFDSLDAGPPAGSLENGWLFDSAGFSPPIESSLNGHANYAEEPSTHPVNSHSVPLSVCLLVKLGSGEADEIRIRSGQVVAIGSSGSADFSFANSNLRPRHFRIHCVKDEVRVECFAARNPVSLNGISIVTGRLFDNDILTAGNAEFHVTLNGNQSGALRSDGDTNLEGSKSEESTKITKFAAPNRLNATAIASSSQLTKAIRVAGSSNELPMIDLLKSLQSYLKVYLLVDFFRMRQPGLPTKDQEPHRVSSGPPGSVGAFLIPVDDQTQLESFHKQIAQFDCGMFLFSSLEHDEFRSRICSITNNEQPMCDVCWPSVMRILLASGNATNVDAFVEVVDFAVLDGEGPQQWEVYCDDQRTERLRKLGLKVQQSEASDNLKQETTDA